MGALVHPHLLKIGDKIAPHADDKEDWERIVSITLDDQQCHFCVYTDKIPDYPILFSRADLVWCDSADPQEPKQPLEEKDAEIERLRHQIAVKDAAIKVAREWVAQFDMRAPDCAQLDTMLCMALDCK